MHVQHEIWNHLVKTAGIQAVPPNSVTQVHLMEYTFNYKNGCVLDEFQTIYITKGSGTFESASCKNVAIGEGTVFFLSPGELHRFRPEQLTGWDSYWLGFNVKFAENLVADGYLSVNKPVVKMGYNL